MWILKISSKGQDLRNFPISRTETADRIANVLWRGARASDYIGVTFVTKGMLWEIAAILPRVDNLLIELLESVDQPMTIDLIKVN